MSTYSMFVGRLTIPAYDLTINSTAYALTAGHYFLYGYSGEGTNQLLEHLEATLQNEYGSASVTLDVSTGKVTIDLGTTGTVDFDDTALRDLLGYTGNLSGASSYEATNECQYIWRPSRQVSIFPHYDDATNFWIPESDTIINRSENGTIFTLEGTTRYSGNLGYRFLTAADVLTPSDGSRDVSFQHFWLNVCKEGQYFRWLPDRTSYTSTSDYVTAVLSPSDGMRLGSFAEYRSRWMESYNSFWHIDLPLWKYVS